jgi:hypothetical protein
VKARPRDRRCLALQPNQTWAINIVHDQLAMGKKIRTLTVADIFLRFQPVVDPRLNDLAENAVRTLEGVREQVGFPKTIRVEQGSGFVSRGWPHPQLLEARQAAQAASNNLLDRLRPSVIAYVRVELCPHLFLEIDLRS